MTVRLPPPRLQQHRDDSPQRILRPPRSTGEEPKSLSFGSWIGAGHAAHSSEIDENAPTFGQNSATTGTASGQSRGGSGPTRSNGSCWRQPAGCTGPSHSSIMRAGLRSAPSVALEPGPCGNRAQRTAPFPARRSRERRKPDMNGQRRPRLSRNFRKADQSRANFSALLASRPSQSEKCGHLSRIRSSPIMFTARFPCNRLL